MKKKGLTPPYSFSCLCSAEGIIRSVLFNSNPDNIADGDSLFIVLGSHNAAELEKLLEQIPRTGSSAESLILLDGSGPEPGRARITAHRLPDGMVVFSLEEVSDTTVAASKRELEGSVRQREERYRSISEGGLDAFYLLKHDEEADSGRGDFIIVDINAAAETELSMKRSDLLGNGICELFPVNREKGFFDRYLRVFREKTAYEGEYQVPSEYTAPGWYYHQVLPTVDGVAIYNRDITARRVAEKELRDNEERFRDVVENIADLIIQFDLQGRISYVNKAVEPILGVRPEKLTGAHLYDFVDENDADSLRDSLLMIELNRQGTYENVYRFRHQDGSFRSVQLALNVHPPGEGQTQITAIGQDVTEKLRYEEQLRASEERFRAIISSASDAMIMFDLEGAIHFANDAAVSMLKSSTANKLTTLHRKDFFIADNYKRFLEMQSDVVDGRTVKSRRIKMNRGDGSDFPVEISASLIRGSTGEAAYMMTIIRDISGREEAEKALRQSEQRYRDLVETIEEGVGIVDNDEVFSFVNNSAARIFGTKKEKMIGSSLREYVSASTFSFLGRETALRKRKVTSRYEVEIIRKDSGEPRKLTVTASPRVDESGTTLGTFGIFHDITEQRQAEEELRKHRERLEEMVALRTEALKEVNKRLSVEIKQKTAAQRELEDSRSKYRMVVENSSNAIAVLSEGELKLVNPQFKRVFNTNKINLTDRELFQVVARDHRELLEQRYDDVFAGKPVSLSQQFRITDFAGIERWLESKEALISWEGEPALLIFLNDITVEKEAREKSEKQKEQLVQADKLASLGTLVAGVAHEINNPNNYILLSAQTMSDAWKSVLPVLNAYYEENGDFSLAGVPYSRMKDKIVTLSEGVFDSSLRIKELVNNLKDFARQGPSGTDLELQINSIVKNALQLMSNTIEKTTDKLTVNLENGLPPVRGNANRLIQVAVNLLQNACDAIESKQDGIAVKTFLENGRVVFSVEDEGCGILEENMKNVMDPFFTTKRDKGGTGLGLSISSGIMEDHGGELVLTSNEGRGATARAILPALEERPNE